MSNTTFAGLGIDDQLVSAVQREGYDHPTPVQRQAIPALISGRDLLGIAQTGTGKTAAFVLPTLQALAAEGRPAEPGRPRAMILAPTRELAIQIGERVGAYGRNLRLRHTVIYGGVGQNPQTAALARGVDVLIATPGRLLDLVGQRHVRLDRVRIFVIDEADRMLDMGFIRDIRRIVGMVPTERQSMLFSATMAPEIERIAADFLRDPVRVNVSPQEPAVERIAQWVVFVDAARKRDLLRSVLDGDDLRKVIVFSRTKHGANKIARNLAGAGVDATAIHGNKSQSARQAAIASFRDGRTRVLVATDVASRGIDIADVSHVINFDLPNEPEGYVHRIGRTGRAGSDGVAISFCDQSEIGYLHAIERLTRRKLGVVEVDFGPGGAAAPRSAASAEARPMAGPSRARANGARRGRARRAAA